jgi:hypothetical protein
MNFIRLIKNYSLVFANWFFYHKCCLLYITNWLRVRKKEMLFYLGTGLKLYHVKLKKGNRNPGPAKRRICIYILHLTNLKEACLAKPVYSYTHDRGQADLPTVPEDLRSSEQLH